MSYGEMGMPYGRQVKLPSVDARGRTWNTRLRKPVLCPLSYVDRVQRGSGAVRTPEAHGSGGRESRTPRPAGRRPSAFETGGLTTGPGPPGLRPRPGSN